MAQGMAWTAPARAGVAVPSIRRVSLHWLIRGSLFLSFLLSYVQYEVNSSSAQYLPLGFFMLCGVLVLCGRHRTERMQHLFSGGALLFIAVLFGEAISYTSHDSYSTAYGLVFIGMILSARLLVQEIGIPNVVRAYSEAAIMTACIVAVSGRRAAAAGARFSGGTRAHPNLVAFFLGGFFPVLVWRAMEEKGRWKRRFLIGLCFTTFAFTFFTGSRGALGAVTFAGVALLVRGAISAGWLNRFHFRHLHVILLLFLFPLLLGYLVQNHRLDHIGYYLSDSLSLKTSQRGLNSGLSGRTNFWKRALFILRVNNRWLLGFGYRAGDRLVGTIDNGYVQLLFESGLIGGVMILGSIIRVFVLLWRASGLRENNAWTRYYAMLWCIMIVYFLNNISTRYLFSFGTSFSLLVLLMTVSSRKELVGPGRQEQMEKPVRTRSRANKLVWNRSER